ncbi:hypothetical protein [Sulfitobacter sp. SH24]|uniref:hypothetical protein n=1 Tax=Sulfitobacter sp. SH24 TaxID=3421173 RepID=UPI003F4F9E8C
MSAVIGSLRVDLGLDSAKFSKGASQAQKSLANMRKQFAAVTGVVAAMGAAITTAALAGAKQIDEAAKAARRLDSSIGGFRALQLAASEAGVNLSSLTNDIQTMNRELSSIGTSGNAARALDALGLSLADLSGLDADEKLAAIADRVKALGLSSGETTAILRDLGVRNREMSLLMLQGGDAIRAAREDISAYGLAISSVDASRIEQANDRIGRLGLITQYAGQQLALELVPALGAMAQAMTESLKAGGALRAMIDGFVGNLNELAGIAIVATTAFGTRYVGAMVAARLATLKFVGALNLMKKALIRTGIGALIVGAGVLVGKFLDLMGAAGGFGKALTLLGEVAGKVWQGIVASAAAIPPALNGVWQLMKSGFLLALSDMATGFFDFIWNIADGLSGVPAFEGMSASLMRLAEGADAASGSLARAGYEAKAAADGAFSTAAGTIRDAFSPAWDALDKLTDVTVETTETTEDLNDTLDDTETSGGKAAKGAGRAAEAIERAKSEAEGYANALKDAAFTAEELGTEKANTLISGIDGVSDAWGDWVARGFKDFKGFTKSILSNFTGMISQMVSLAAKQRIMFDMGITAGGGVAGAAGQAAPSGGGMLGNLMGLGGGAGGGLLGGFGNAGSILGMGGFGGGTGLLGGLGNAISGGIGNIFSIGANAAAAGGGLLATVGAAVPVLGLAAAAFSFFTKKTKELDSGLRVTVTGMDSLLESFRYVEESRFWGLSKKKKTYYTELAAEDADPLEKVIHDLQTGILQTAEALNVGTDAFDDFAYQMKISTKGLSEDEAQAAIIEALQGLSDEFAGMVPGLADLQLEGEGAATTLQRIVTELQTVNDALYLFDRAALEASVAGAAMASNLVALSGGLEAFATKTQYVFENMLTGAAQDARLTEMALDQLTDTFGDLQFAIPSTHAQFMALLDAQDLTTQAGRETHAALLDVAGAFVQVNGTAQGAADAVQNASAELARQAEAVLNERLGLETELLRLTGETAELRRRELEALDPTNRALQQMIWNVTDLTDELHAFDAATAAQIVALQDRYSNAALEAQLAAIDGQIATAQKAIEDFNSARLDQINVDIDRRLDQTLSRLERAKSAVSDVLDGLRDNLDGIRDAIASRGPVGADQEVASYRNAQAALQSFADGKAYTPDELQAALEGVSVDTGGFFATLQEMVLDRAKTTSVLAELEGQAMGQVSVAEAQLAAADRRITQAQLAAEEDREFHASQLAAMDDAEDVYASMDDALAGLREFAARREDILALMSANEASLDRELYQFEKLRAEMRTNIAATVDVKDAIAGLSSALGATPGFALGGNHGGGLRIVGENGPELEATGPSRIYSASQLRRMMQPKPAYVPTSGLQPAGQGGLQAVRDEIAQLTREVKSGNAAALEKAKAILHIQERFRDNGVETYQVGAV